MAFRLISARGVVDDLAAGRITAQEQSLYLIASFLIWIIPAYLFVFPAPRTDDFHFFWSVWLVELALLVLVDFSCLNAPISLTTLAVVWGGFYIVTGPIFSLSPRAYDIVRMCASAGAVLVVFLRIGRHMERVSLLRI